MDVDDLLLVLEVVDAEMMDTSDIPDPYKTVTTLLLGKVTVWVLGGNVHESKSGPSYPNANPKSGSTF